MTVRTHRCKDTIMNREILFRGKRVDTGEWVEGFYWCIKDTHFIRGLKKLHIFDCEVHPSTVGQYTGFKNKNGTKIFEGNRVDDEWTVVWSSVNCGWDCVHDDGVSECSLLDCLDGIITGNIHDK